MFAKIEAKDTQANKQFDIVAFEMAWGNAHKYEETAVDMFWASQIRVGKGGILSQFFFFVAQKKKLHRARKKSDCFPDTIVIRPCGILSA